MGFLPREIHSFLVENGELILGILIMGAVVYILTFLVVAIFEDFKL